MATHSLWKEARDARTGRTYYYNTSTRATQWNKPKELATPLELEEMNAKEAQQRAFFAEMERNIKERLHEEPTPLMEERQRLQREQEEDRKRLEAELERSRRFRGGDSHRKSSSIRLIRTISTIDDSVLEELKRRGSNDYTSAEVRTGKRDSVREFKSDVLHEVDDEENDDAVPVHLVSNPKPKITRRNSTGTIYVDSVMSHQDNDATIRCVCAVIRAHMIVSAKDPNYDQSHVALEVFRDEDISFDEEQRMEGLRPVHRVPSFSKIRAFYKNVHENAKMESECIIMSLIYIEKLIKATRGKLKIKWNNWRPVVFTCMVMASKVWDDLSMWNADFSQVCPSFTLKRINELELAVLDTLRYSIKVSAGEYAKYYFHLRSMMARLNTSMPCLPLNIAEARRLELATQQYQTLKAKDPVMLRRRCLTVSEGEDPEVLEHMHVSGIDHYPLVSLEQMIHAVHSDADGLPHKPRSRRGSALRPSEATT